MVMLARLLREGAVQDGIDIGLEEGIKKGREQGLAEGKKQGLAEAKSQFRREQFGQQIKAEAIERGKKIGAAANQKKWEGWNYRRLVAQELGVEFDEPPPTLDDIRDKD